MRSGELAEKLSLTPMAIRQHLAAMEAEGEVESETVQSGVGRPAKLWRLTPSAAKRFPDTHAELAVGMIDAIRAALGEEGLVRVVKERTSRQEAAYRRALSGCTSLSERVAALANLRSHEGYMAVWANEGEGYFLIENHCPICAAAAACKGICEGELELFRSLIGEGVSVTRTEHIVSGARRCVYDIKPTHTVS